MIEVERVNQNEFTKASTFMKFHKGGDFGGSYSIEQSVRGYTAHPIESLLMAST